MIPWPGKVILDGLEYPSVENAYQAAKTYPDARVDFLTCSAKEAKKLGRKIIIREDWDSVKLGVMKDLVRQKFSIPELRDLLIATGDQEIVEGNYWKDTFWGVCNGQGENHLGRIIMEIREEIRLME